MSSADGQPDLQTRRELLRALAAAGREHSEATVILHASIAEAMGLGPTGHKVMSLLERHGRLTAGAIATHTGLTTGSVTALIDRLQRRGFVQRRSDPTDRRRILVEPNRDAIAHLAAYHAARKQPLARLYERYSDDKLRVILDFLERSARRLRSDMTALTTTTRSTDDPRSH